MVKTGNVLEAKNIFFSYKNRTVLENLSISLGEGELLCLLGPNGAGKTTLFRCILGLEKYRGSIAVNGSEVSDLRPPELAKKLAYVPQTNYPSFNYTVFEMVLMGTASLGVEWSIPGQAQKNAASKAIEMAGISDLAGRNYLSLSGGEQQLCLIARAIAQQAGIFIMDEPTANLDYGNQFRILELIRFLCTKGISIIMSTHNPDHALRFADRIAALHNHVIYAEGPAEETLKPGLIKELFGVDITDKKEKSDISTGRLCKAT